MISDYSKYKNHGWGLSKLAFEKLSNIMSIIIKESKNLDILEFGSGISTEFLLDNIILNDWADISSITSFDNDQEYMYKILYVLLMKSSILVGGQAVIEGVMMRVPGAYATAVRKSDRTIAIDYHQFHSKVTQNSFCSLPIILLLVAVL